MIAEYLAMLRRFDRNIRLYLIAGSLLGFTTAGGIIGVLMNLYVLRLGYDIEFVGILNFAGALSFGLFSLPAGAIGRRWGPRRSMVFGLLLIVVGNLALPAAESIAESWRAEFLVITRLPRAFGFALYHVNANPFIMAATGPAERTHVFSVQAAFWSLAGFFGSLLGGFLPGIFSQLIDQAATDPGPYRLSLLVGTVVLIPAVFVMRRAREVEVVEPAETGSEGGQRPTQLIIVIATASFLLMAGVTGLQVFFNVYLDDGLGIDIALIGSIQAASQLFAGLAALATPLVAGRWGHVRTITWGSVGTILCLLPLAVSSDWKVAGCGFVLISALGTVRYAAMSVYQQEMVRARWRSQMSVASNLVAGLSYSTVPLIGGFAIAAFGYQSLFLTSPALTVVGVLVFWSYFRTPRGEHRQSMAGT